MSGLTIKDHWLVTGEKVSHQKTPNTRGGFAEGQPDTLVLHFTGGRSAQSSADWLCNPKAKASAHQVIGKDGTIIQLADFQTVTWHAGRSTWEGRNGLNPYSIGIEMDNAGKLEHRANGFYTWFGTQVPEDEVIEATHRNQKEPAHWQTFTEAQIECVEALCKQLIEAYDIQTIVGHEEISPRRKVDPGPAFPLDQLRLRLTEGDRSKDEQEIIHPTAQGIITADRLNIRSMPNISSPTVADPLKRGTLVSIEEEQSGWVKVRVETTGWVKKDYLKTTTI